MKILIPPSEGKSLINTSSVKFKNTLELKEARLDGRKYIGIILANKKDIKFDDKKN